MEKLKNAASCCCRTMEWKQESIGVGAELLHQMLQFPSRLLKASLSLATIASIESSLLHLFVAKQVSSLSGGPGSGKGTQCSKIVSQFGFTHLSAGELLREEAKSDTEQGIMIKNLMHEGKLVPSEIIVKLLLKAMLQSGSDRFVVDGFPRNEENRQAYEKIINVEPEFILFIDCPKEELERRILSRNQERDDDNIDTIRRRFEVFQEATLPVVQYYEKRGKLRRVDGAKSPDEVFKDVKPIFEQLNTQIDK
ncbi:hypothetical protein PR202_ga18371 [Eleusine coracana subsp. coracana]|uniref:adenylate kinase n=1 Tax=Eleusine coracana subsp. coracana TaxID=191504 RepID=A0AAV5CT64_ELECO|nr:hypothetical protein PR202_ga18371 [Eleusine coracana subsp. coracana]